MKNKYLPYAIDFVSFMLERLDLDKIKNIILFGSVARNEAIKDSDIDIFLDITNNEIEYRRRIKNIIEDYYKSKFFNNYWKPKGITNTFNIKIGKLDEWKELKDSIISSGIVLYSKFKSKPEQYDYKVLISFENVKPESKRVLLHKNLYGYNFNNKHYEGLIGKYKGLKLNKGTILISLEHKNVFISLFKRFNVTYKIINLLEY